MNRKAIRQTVQSQGIEKAMRVPKGSLTPKMKRFAEEIALGETGAQAYRLAYSSKAKPKTAGDAASRLKSDSRVAAEIERIERANELAALHSATGLRSIVISTLAEIATNPEEKAATRVQAVRSIGQLVGVDAFRETKRVEHVKDSGELRAQILDQLKTMMLSTNDAVDVDANSLLAELSEPEPHRTGTPPNAEWDSDAHVHSNELEQSQQISDPAISNPEPSESDPSEDPPSPAETR
jgi:phage terminase small subunit